MKQAVDLEPCPFCGTRLERNASFSSRRRVYFTHTAQQRHCRLFGVIVCSDLPEDVASWNRRSPPAAPRPIAEATRDGTMYRLLVHYENGGGPLEDATVAWTIGHNNFDNDGEDVWQFAGWSWSQDHYCQGSGRVTHFLPFKNPNPEAVK